MIYNVPKLSEGMTLEQYQEFNNMSETEHWTGKYDIDGDKVYEKSVKSMTGLGIDMFVDEPKTIISISGYSTNPLGFLGGSYLYGSDGNRYWTQLMAFMRYGRLIVDSQAGRTLANGTVVYDTQRQAIYTVQYTCTGR